METGIELIAKERNEQIEKHGRTLARDIIENAGGELQTGAICILLADHDPEFAEWFPEKWDKKLLEKIDAKDQVERLTIAGALIAAEIDRLKAKVA